MTNPAQAGTAGLAPSVLINPYNPERARYEKLWSEEEYRKNSPGEQMAMTFLSQARVENDADVLDIGCGSGRGGLMLALFGGMRVTLLDFAPNCLDPEVSQACQTQPDRIKFVTSDLVLQTIPVNAAYGYCCDVMEHIPTDAVPRVLRNILASANHVFFAISTVDDYFGPKVFGAPLHHTVRPANWWVDQIVSAGGVIHAHSEYDGGCWIYCSAWKDAKDLLPDGVVNTDMAVVESQTTANIQANWNHVTPYVKQDRELILLAGGPSMNGCEETIRKLRSEGAGLVTVNGAYAWALRHGLEPSIQIVLDAREFNSRFTYPVTPYTKYLIASQVHPATLENLPKDRTFLWHSGISQKNEELVRDKTGYFFPIPGGSTVVLRAIPLLRMLGFCQIHIFGFDSCVQDGGVHHAYDQPENDREPLISVTCGGRTFSCTPWMLSQASEFRDLVGFLGNEVELAVYGDGLISQMIATGATLSKQEH